MYICLNQSLYVHMSEPIPVCIFVCTYLSVYMSVPVYVSMCAYLYLYMYVCTYVLHACLATNGPFRVRSDFNFHLFIMQLLR